MSEFYLLSYKSIPLGIYNKLYYLLDYILELIRFPDKKINLFDIEINLFNVNIAYPSCTLIFKKNINNNRIYFEELNGKRVEMSEETFNRFKKIQNYFMNLNLTKTTELKKEVKLETVNEIKSDNKQEKNILSNEELEEINKKKMEIANEQKETIHNMNRLKHHMKIITNWQTKFMEDLKLYNSFKEKLIEDKNFKIPEMFENTFNFLKECENPNESFTEYFMKFNKDSDLDVSEINKILNEIESDSDFNSELDN